MKSIPYLRVSVLGIWILSLLLWDFVVAIILIFDFAGPWFLGMIAFMMSFICMVTFLTFWWRNPPQQSLPSRFLRASLLATCFHSLLLFGYLAARVLVGEASLGAPFIDVLLPWLTFLRLGIIALFLGLFSIMGYAILFWRKDHKQVVERLS